MSAHPGTTASPVCGEAWRARSCCSPASSAQQPSWRPGAPPCGDAGPRAGHGAGAGPRRRPARLAVRSARCAGDDRVRDEPDPRASRRWRSTHRCSTQDWPRPAERPWSPSGPPDPWPVARRWLLASVGAADRGDDARCRVELHGAGLGRVLGMGSGGEHVAARLDGRARGDPRRAPRAPGRGVRDRRDAVDAGRARRRARAIGAHAVGARLRRAARRRLGDVRARDRHRRSGVPGCSCAVATSALRTRTPTGDV